MSHTQIHLIYCITYMVLMYYLMDFVDFNVNHAQTYVFRTDVMASKDAVTVSFS